MTPRPRPTKAKPRGKALPPATIVFRKPRTPIMVLWNASERVWARGVYMVKDGYRYVRYIPAPRGRSSR